jgi:hypothetical protein
MLTHTTKEGTMAPYAATKAPLTEAYLHRMTQRDDGSSYICPHNVYMTEVCEDCGRIPPYIRRP